MLTTLVERVPGARGAIFCDHEGESVELVLRDQQLSEYEMKIFGAQLAAVWQSLQESSSQTGTGPTQELHVTCASGSLICRSLPDGYYVVLLIGQGAPAASAGFALRAAAAEIAAALQE
jgi:predicted regulator of Ras-like GTPase activity (Roadblock/LC7/MglB family)